VLLLLVEDIVIDLSSLDIAHAGSAVDRLQVDPTGIANDYRTKKYICIPNISDCDGGGECVWLISGGACRAASAATLTTKVGCGFQDRQPGIRVRDRPAGRNAIPEEPAQGPGRWRRPYRNSSPRRQCASRMYSNETMIRARAQPIIGVSSENINSTRLTSVNFCSSIRITSL
jgi:hypothetical protein